MDPRNSAFQRLKPLCVALSEAALALTGSSRDSQSAISRLEALHNTLSSITANSDALDAKLADYVFFPLSQLLRSSQKLPIRGLELCLEDIAILVEYGWSRNIQPPLAAQVAILCTLLAETKPKGFAFTQSSTELQAAAFLCLAQVFTAASNQKDAKAVFINESSFPQLAQTINVILEGILIGGSLDVQANATKALITIVRDILSQDLCTNFLPGILSKLVKVLTPSTQQRRNHTVLTGGLDAVSVLLTRTVGRKSATGTEASEATNAIDDDWLRNAREQLKPALVSIFRLHNHSRSDVRTSLVRLCMVLLRDCRKNLPDCFGLALEAAVEITALDETADYLSELNSLLEMEPASRTLASMTLYEWLKSLPTWMQSADEQEKARRLQQMGVLYKLLAGSGAEMGTISRSLSTALHECIVITLQLGRQSEHKAAVPGVQSLDLEIVDSTTGNLHFSNVLVSASGQKAVFEAVAQLAALLSKSPGASSLSTDLTRALVTSHGEARLANAWLLLEYCRSAQDGGMDFDNLLNFDDESSPTNDTALEEAYSFALATLAEVDEPTDPRLVSLCLQTLAQRAKDVGEDFRFELVDALYPVLHTLATPDDRLQQDSITTLNILREVCGYRSVRDLIVGNADYLVNAVALKLNAFEVSPQAPLVLIMMIRLAGPALLPYLEDTIESIFAALEDFQGYPLLVELLFRVLHVMAEEGVKAPQLSITGPVSDEINALLHEEWKPISMVELADKINDLAKEEDRRSPDLEQHPKTPWSELDRLDINKDNNTDALVDNASEAAHDEVEDRPPAPKVFGMLLKMTEITQHYLPSASVSLRTSLLSLITTTIPALAKHENSFLPLVNTLWPEVTSRLEDAEPHIQASALDTIAILAEYAGDFMRSRIVQLWPALVDLHHKMTNENQTSTGNAQYRTILSSSTKGDTNMAIARQPMHDVARVSANDFIHTSSRLVKDALMNALLAITRKTRLPPDLLDEALEMLEPVLKSDEVRATLATECADAVWLLQLRSGMISPPETPTAPADVTWQFASIPAYI